MIRDELIHPEERVMEGLRRKILPWLSALVISFILSFGAGLAYAHPSYYGAPYGYRAKHHKHKKISYKYIYYPRAQVYYSPFQRGYYFLNNGYWNFGNYAPRRVRLGPSVTINLGGPVPYYYHPTVLSKYPVPVGYPGYYYY